MDLHFAHTLPIRPWQTQTKPNRIILVFFNDIGQLVEFIGVMKMSFLGLKIPRSLVSVRVRFSSQAPE